MFAVIRCTNGAFAVQNEYGEENAARVGFHQHCAALYNEKTVDVHATVVLFNESMDMIDKETINVTQPKEQPQGE